MPTPKVSTPPVARITHDLLAVRRRIGAGLLERYERAFVAVMEREVALAEGLGAPRVAMVAEIHADLVLQLVRAQTSMARKLYGLGNGSQPQVIGGRRIDGGLSGSPRD